MIVEYEATYKWQGRGDVTRADRYIVQNVNITV